MTKDPSKDRMIEKRAERRAAGFTEICIWVHKSDSQTVKAYANGLLTARDKKGMFQRLTKKTS